MREKPFDHYDAMIETGIEQSAPPAPAVKPSEIVAKSVRSDATLRTEIVT